MKVEVEMGTLEAAGDGGEVTDDDWIWMEAQDGSDSAAAVQ